MSSDPLAHLRHRFRERCATDLAEIEALQASMPEDLAGRLKFIAHGLSGIAGSFGYDEISAIAAGIDNALVNNGMPKSTDIDNLRGALAMVAGQHLSE
jgi:HPt (histidine-containing phosphotransfer) domain-containing protein